MMMKLSLEKYLLVIACMATASCNKSEIILEDLSQKEANEIIVLLSDQNIFAKKISFKDRKQTNFKIEVEQKDKQNALKTLLKWQLPKEKNTGLKEVYPPGSQALIPSKAEENARIVMAVQGEIEKLLHLIPNVIEAKVMISLPSPLEQSSQAAKSYKSAAVALTYNADAETKPLDEGEIKNLVASAVGGLLEEQVSVLMKQVSTKVIEDKTVNLNESPSALNTKMALGLSLLGLLVGLYGLIRIYLTKKAPIKPQQASHE